MAPRVLAVVALAALGGGAGLASTAMAAQASPLSASGNVIGEVKPGATVHVRIVVQHTGGWQQISEVELDLQLRGKPLEQLVIDPTNDSVVLAGAAGPTALGEHASFNGTFFGLDPADIGLSAKGPRLSLSLPITLRAAPPPGARLTLQARGFDVTATRATPLTPPVEDEGGFSWGTLGVAIAGALFVGSFLGGVFASRRRPPPRPSVYSAVQRRIDQERART